MSKERRRRREAREAAERLASARSRDRQRRAERRGVALQPVTAPLRRLGAALRPTRRSRPDSVLAARRRRQDAALVAVLLGLNVLLWTQVADPLLRAVAAVLSVIAWPVLVTLVFDRRSS